MATVNKHIQYKGGYKYQLYKTYIHDVKIYPPEEINTKYIILDPNGKLIIKEGYAWDGPSGPTIDTSNFMRGSLVHDALYQLIREERLHEKDREEADLELKRICREDGMSKFRAWYVWKSVSKYASAAASPSHIKKICIAPEE